MSHDPEVMVSKLVNGVEQYNISTDLLDAAVEEIQELVAQRDRARELAAHLEEIVAMRTSVLAALIEAYDKDLFQLPSIVGWAKAQLSEVP